MSITAAKITEIILRAVFFIFHSPKHLIVMAKNTYTYYYIIITSGNQVFFIYLCIFPVNVNFLYIPKLSAGKNKIKKILTFTTRYAIIISCRHNILLPGRFIVCRCLKSTEIYVSKGKERK
jgi:hypothetical protein